MNPALARVHHDGSALYVADAAPALGDVVEVRLRVPVELQPTQVVLRTVADGEPRTHEAIAGEIEGPDRWWTAALPIRNPLTHYRWLILGPDDEYHWLTAAGMFDHDVSDAGDFAISAFAPNPDWSHRAVVYQIFPDRFATSGRIYDVPAWAVPRAWDQRPEGRGPNTGKEYFGGDLWGVIDRLDYLQSLGVSVLYFTPVFPAGSTHRYDAASFDAVDPLLGGDEALVALTEAAHARGMKVIGDLTLNHSGNLHAWFVSAAAGDPATRDFYTFDSTLEHGYESWFGVRSLPKFNYRSQALRERLISGTNSVLRRWLRAPFNLDGWRVDVANMTGRQADIDLNQEIARLTRKTVIEEGGDKLLIAEHFHDAGPDLPGDGWQGTMNYTAFMKPVWSWLRADTYAGGLLGTPAPKFSTRQMVSTMHAFASRMPWRSWVASWTILSSHDTARVRTVVGSRERQIAAATLLMTTPGVPMIFAGDELGAEGSWGEDSRTTFPWDARETWDTALHDAYRALIAMRRTSDALAVGGFRWVHLGDDVVAYLRETRTERVLAVAARRAAGAVHITAAHFGITAIESVFGFDARLVNGELIIDVPDAGGGVWVVS